MKSKVFIAREKGKNLKSQMALLSSRQVLLCHTKTENSDLTTKTQLPTGEAEEEPSLEACRAAPPRPLPRPPPPPLPLPPRPRPRVKFARLAPLLNEDGLAEEDSLPAALRLPPRPRPFPLAMLALLAPALSEADERAPVGDGL